MKKKIQETKRSRFIHKQIRLLNDNEKAFLAELKKVITLKVEQVIIGNIPSFFSTDGKARSLILHKDVVKKIQDKHGEIIIENLLINTHDWDIGIKNMDNIYQKINLIKLIPESKNFLLIGAEQRNGYFILTHFETEVLQGNELKSLLGRGDFFNRDA